MRELRDYQVTGLDNLRQTLRQGVKRIVVQLPTGGGKTLIAATIANGALQKKNKLAFTVPRISLIDQTLEEFYEEEVRDVGVVQANHIMTDYSKPIQICSIDTVRSRGHYPDAKVVIFDEVHLFYEAHKAWMDEQPNTIFIGLSATPWKVGLGQYFDTLLVMETTKGLIEKGWLSPFRVFAAAHPDLTGVKIVAGEYHEGQLSEKMQEGTLTADIVQTWKDKWGKDKTLCFAVDCAHAQAIQRRFEEAGIAAGYQDARTPMDERREIKRRFHSGDFPVVVSVGTLTIGVDWDVRCISMCRPTRSEMLYCLDYDTEILTSHGWKGPREIREGDVVPAMSDIKTGAGCWSRVKATIERQMSADEKWVSYSAPRVNFRVTGDHVMVCSGGGTFQYGAFERRAALEMKDIKGNVYMPTAVEIDQPGIPLTAAELYFIGMMMTDGTWTSTSGSITQSERHPEIIERIESCLQACGIAYSKRRVMPSNGDGPRGEIIERYPRWRFVMSAGKPRPHGNQGRGPHPTKNFYTKVPGTRGFGHLMPFMDKDLSPALMAMSKIQFEVLLKGIFDGDGFKMKSPSVDWTPRSWTICSSRAVCVDRLQALAAINGFTGHLRKEHQGRANPIYILTVTPRWWRSVGGYDSGGQRRPQIEVSTSTNEMVWCIETDAGTIITRRRGKVTVMGNCQIIGRGLRTAEGKEDLLLLDHSDNTQRLGFVTDIHHDRLSMGKDTTPGDKASAIPDPTPPLPKACKQCGMLRPVKVQVCPNCGFKAELVSGIVERDGELVEVTNGKRERGKKREYTLDEKARFYAELKAYALLHGRKNGWAFHNYVDKFGVKPDWSIDGIPPAAYPSTATVQWVKSRLIAWAKSRRNPRNQKKETEHAAECT